MSTEMQTKVQASPAQSFTPAQTGLLQRKSALYNTPGLVDDSKQDKEKLTLQRSLVDQAGTTTVPRFGHDFSRVNVHSTRPGMIQAKLKINEPGDLYEQEADRVAEQVMSMEKPRVQRQPEEELVQKKPVITPLVQRQSEEEEEEEEEFIQTKELPHQSPEVTPALSSHIQSLKGGGQTLPESVRAYFEPRFGYDFSQVRVHTYSRAAEQALAMNARAFTIGRDVVFGEGQYMSGTSEGQQLIAHELTHVLQQTGEDGIHVDESNRKHGMPPISSLLSTYTLTTHLIQREQATATIDEVQPATPAVRQEFLRVTIDFLRGQGESFSRNFTLNLTEIFGYLRTTFVRGLGLIQGDLVETSAADDLRSAYRDAVHIVLFFRSLPRPGAMDPPTLQQLYEQHLDEILPFALPQGQADPSASELSAELTAPLPDSPSSDQRNRHEAIESARQRLQVVTASVDMSIDDLFSTEVATTTVPLPQNTTARLSSTIPTYLRHGLQNVAGRLMGEVLTPNTTVMLALDLTPYGGGYSSYRFTRLDLGLLGIEVLIERQGSIGIEGLQDEQRRQLQERFDRVGFRRGRGFDQEEFDQVLIGISQIPEARLTSLSVLEFEQQASDPLYPNASGHYDQFAQPHMIRVFDRAFSGGVQRFGRGDCPLTSAASTVVHEIGHALDLSSLRTTAAATQTAHEALLNVFGTGGQNYEIPHPNEPERAQFDALMQGISGAEAAELAARSRSGARWTTEGEVTDVLAGGASQPAFRQAALQDGGPAGARIPTTYPNPESVWQEYFAESFVLFQTSPELLQRMRPNVFNFMQQEFP